MYFEREAGVMIFQFYCMIEECEGRWLIERSGQIDVLRSDMGTGTWKTTMCLVSYYFNFSCS